MLAIPLFLALATGQIASTKTTVKTAMTVLRSFDVDDATCELKVTSRDLPIPDKKITIACNRLTVLTEDIGQAGILKVDIVGHNSFDLNAVRGLVTFERGLTVTLVAYEISKSRDKLTARIVYEHSAETAAEAFEDGDVILEHVKRRFLGDRILPGGTNFYRWQDGEYKFTESFQWNEDATWVARYCTLYKPESCPAKRAKTRIRDEYER